MRLKNFRVDKYGTLRIDDNSIGIQCISCFSYHSWTTGKLIKEVKKNSKIN